jgi:hypothetical protein
VIAEFIAEHGEVTTRHWQGRIRGDGLCEEMESVFPSEIWAMRDDGLPGLE